MPWLVLFRRPKDRCVDDVLAQALESMTKWPLVNRNKVIDSKVHVSVESCAALEDEAVRNLAQKVALCVPLFGYFLIGLSAPRSLEYSSCIQPDTEETDRSKSL